jgi:uncharacterized protein (DUF2141 family)
MNTTVNRVNRFTVISTACCLILASAGLVFAQAPVAPAAAPSAPAVATAKSNLSVHLTGFRNAKGRVNVALFRDGKGFPMDIASAAETQRLEIDPQTKAVTAVFANLPQGSYAVAVLHDENLTGKMDYDSQGIPQEGYGISNNPDTTTGPPTPEAASFTVNQPESKIEIKLVYWQ